MVRGEEGNLFWNTVAGLAGSAPASKDDTVSYRRPTKEELIKKYPNPTTKTTQATKIPNMKTIIGYKLKKEEYRKAAETIAEYFYVPLRPLESYLPNNGGKSEHHFMPKLRNAGVLDLWFEPIYKEEINIEVGDVVIVTHHTDEDRLGIKNFSIGEVFTVSRIGDSTFPEINKWVYTSDGSGKEISINSLRKATEEEIKAQFPTGTWVVLVSNKAGSGYRAGDIGKIGINRAGTHAAVVDVKGKNTSANSCFYTDLRKATPEEIKKASGTTLTIGSRNTTVQITGGVITSHGRVWNRPEIEQLVKHHTRQSSLLSYSVGVDYDVRFIRIGCTDENNLFSIKELQSVLNASA
jgi:hypothetical protein